MLTNVQGQKRGRRMKGTTVSKPIVYGNVTYALPQPRGNTHSWACYVRGAKNEDLSPLIRRVEFLLHPTFSDPRRIVGAPGPFAINEVGWGEFTVNITLHFAEEFQERPLQLSHGLALYDQDHPPVRDGGSGSDGQALPYTSEQFAKPIIVERYDEIVFRDPTEELYALLTAPVLKRSIDVAPPRGELAFLLAPVINRSDFTFDDTEDVKKIKAADAVVSAKLRELNARYAELEAAEFALKDQLRKLQQPQVQPQP